MSSHETGEAGRGYIASTLYAMFFNNWNLAHFMYQISTGILIFQEPNDF